MIMPIAGAAIAAGHELRPTSGTPHAIGRVPAARLQGPAGKLEARERDLTRGSAMPLREARTAPSR